MIRTFLLALLALALVPAVASAAVVELQVTPRGGADFGELTTVTGKLTGPYGAPLVGRNVELQARPYPFRHRKFKSVEKAQTGLDGRFAFDHAFGRNQRLRVVAPQFGDRSAVLPAFIFPASGLTFNIVRRNVIRLVQRYRTPKSIRLRKPTFFYVAKEGKRTAPLAAKANTRRVRKGGKVRKGRFISTALVRIPKAWKGHFRYASCFPYNKGMGNPHLGCPKKKYRF